MAHRKNRLSRKNLKLKKEKLIPLFPNIITTGSLTLGLASIMSSLQILSIKSVPGADLEQLFGKFWWAASFIGLAIVFDMLDGKVARALGSDSKFGVSYDSLSDLVSFGIAPAVLLYVWCLADAGKMGLMALLFYIICTALRLARFNIQAQKEEKYNFSGLPSPMAAGLMFAPVMLFSEFNRIPTQEVVWYYLILAPLAGIIMVSNIPYRKFLELKLKGQFNTLVIVAIIISAIVSNPSAMVLIIVYLYFLLGIATYIYNFSRDRRGLKKPLSEQEVLDASKPKK